MIDIRIRTYILKSCKLLHSNLTTLQLTTAKNFHHSAPWCQCFDKLLKQKETSEIIQRNSEHFL